MTYDPKSRSARLGDETELRVEDFLRSRSLFVTRLCKIKNPDGIGAPMLMGARFNLILPDFQVIDPRRFGQPYYVEVKGKNEPGWKVTLRAHTHVVDRPNWNHYQNIHKVTGLPIWLLILEDMSGELLGLAVHRTSPDHFCEPNDQFPKGGAFWRKSQFTLIAQLERRQGKMEI